jgi:hypothetical protein
MSNSSFNSSLLSLLTVDVFLDALGYTPWLTILSTFVLPVISFIGAILCSLSAFIFLQPKFKDPVFFFYQLLCLVYIVHLIHNTPNGLLFSLRYYPQIDTYWSRYVLEKCVYLTVLFKINLRFHMIFVKTCRVIFF